jgi:hypothetical protein
VPFEDATVTGPAADRLAFTASAQKSGPSANGRACFLSGLLFFPVAQRPVAGLTTEEKNMRLISAFELHRRSASELSDLFGQVSKGLVLTQFGTPERRNALATLENIARARQALLAQCGPGS